MKLFDLHCDTAFEIYKKKTSLKENTHDISLSRAEKAFESYAQVAAIWTRRGKGDEQCYTDFLLMRQNLVSEIERGGAALCYDFEDIERAWQEKKSAFVLAVEGARILAGKIERLSTLHALGVRFLTLAWGADDVIGGAHDTGAPLTDFGREVVREAMRLGIVVDVSHCSRAMTAEVIDIAKELGKSIVATHSNSAAITNLARNLADDEARAIGALRGLIGISLAPVHLCPGGNAGIADIVKNIKHYLSLGLCDTVALGCDLDGIPNKPEGIFGIEDLQKLADALAAEGISEDITEKIFYKNALRFARDNLK